MNLPSDHDLYGKWDLSELGLDTYFGHLVNDASDFKLIVFVEIDDSQWISPFHVDPLLGKTFKFIKGQTNDKSFYLINPYLRSSKSSFGDSCILEFIFNDLLEGVHLETPDEKFINLIHVELPELSTWENNNKFHSEVNNEEKTISIKYKKSPKLAGEFTINNHKLSLYTFISTHTSSSIFLDKKFYIEFKNLENTSFNLKEAQSIINEIVTFFSLITNKHLIPEVINFTFTNSNDTRIYICKYYNSYLKREKSKYKQNNKSFLYTLEEILPSLETILQTFWRIKHKNMYFLSTLYHLIDVKSIDTYEDFVGLARATEGAHRANENNEVYSKQTSRRLKQSINNLIRNFELINEDNISAEEKAEFTAFFCGKLSKIEEHSLKTRILDILQQVESSGLVNIILEKRNCEKDIYSGTYTKIRNNLTHLDGISHTKYPKSTVIYYIFDFKIFLHLYILVKLGLDLSHHREKLIERIHIH